MGPTIAGVCVGEVGEHLRGSQAPAQRDEEGDDALDWLDDGESLGDLVPPCL